VSIAAIVTALDYIVLNYCDRLLDFQHVLQKSSIFSDPLAASVPLAVVAAAALLFSGVH